MANDKLPQRLDLADQKRTQFFYWIPAGKTVDDVMSPDYWVHVAKFDKIDQGFKPGDLLELVCEDGSFELLLRVMGKAPGRYLKFGVLRLIEADEDATPVITQGADERFKLYHQGFGKYFVQDKKTGQNLAGPMDKEEAKAKIDEYVKTGVVPEPIAA